MELKNFANLVEEIATSQEELEDLHQARIEQDSERLGEIVKIAAKGLDYDRVYSSKKIELIGLDKTMTLKYEYIKNNRGVIFKGIKVGELNEEDQESKIELWLTPNDFVLTSKIIHSNNKTTREIIKKDVNVFEIDNKDNYVWDHEIIKNSILKNLEKKRNNLESRLEAQKRRIDEVNKI